MRYNWVWIGLTILFGVWRCFVPKALDLSATSIHKDFAHLFYGALVYEAFRAKNWILLLWAFALLILEVLLAIFG